VEEALKKTGVAGIETGLTAKAKQMFPLSTHYNPTQ